MQQLDSSYVAAVQPQGSAYGVLLTVPVTSQQPRPLLDVEQQRLPLPSKLHSLHVLQLTSQPAGSSSKPGPSVAAVVLADGTVAAADFSQLCIHPAAASAAPASAATPQGHKQLRSSHHLLSTACSGQLLAVAKQQPGGAAVVDVYTAGSSNGEDAALQPNQPSLQLVNSSTITPPSPGSKLLGVSVSGGLLLVLWSCHTLSVCRSRQPGPVTSLHMPAALAGVLAADEDHVNDGANAAERSTSKRKQRGAAATTAAGGGSCWTAAALSEQHVLLVAVHSEAGSTRVKYTLLDSSYGSCLSSGVFTAGSGSISGRLQLLPLPQHPFAPVALLVAGSVWLLPLQLPKADLAGLVASLGIGSTQAHAAAAAAAPDGAQLLLTSRQQLNLAALAAAVSNGSTGSRQQGPSVLQQLQQVQQPAAVASNAVSAAVQQVQAVLDRQQRPAEQLQGAVSQLCTALEQQAGQAAVSVLVSQQLLAQALSTLAEAQQWSLLERLHSLAPLQSLAACADVLPALVAAQQYSSMRSVLLAAQDIPADSVVKSLLQILQPPQQQQQQQQQQPGQAGAAAGSNEAQQAAAQQVRAAAEAVVQQAEAAAAAGQSEAAAQLVKAARHAATAVDGFTSRELLLHVLLAVQVDSVEAQAALRALPAAAVLRLLRYLVKWLHKFGRNDLSGPSSDPLLLTPSASQVMEWCKLLLDAQLTKLMMTPVAAPLLQELQQLLRAEVSATSKLAALKGVTDTWAMGAPLPAAAAAANSQYVLELLDLRVKPVAVGAKAK